ncbi:MAG TPA: hypothetical protein VIK30_07985 [Polyangia bacterium]
MGFRITSDETSTGSTVLRVEGYLVGEEAAHLLREQIAQAAARGEVIVDLHDVAWYGDACLAILAEPVEGVWLEGGGTLLASFLDQRRALPPTLK